MAACRSWQEGALSQLLLSISSKPRPPAPPATDDRPNALAFALHALPDPEEIALLSALAPRATDAALALIDSALLALHETDLFDENGRPLAHPRVLKHISVKLARDDGRAYIEVSSPSRQSGHLVLLSGIELGADGDGGSRRLRFTAPSGDNAAGGSAYFSCSCRAFEFKHANEMICKHIIVASLAIVSDLASVEEIADDVFVANLNMATATKTSYS